MPASQYHFNAINREYSKFSRAIIGYQLKLLAFKFYSSKIFIIETVNLKKTFYISKFMEFFY